MPVAHASVLVICCWNVWMAGWTSDVVKSSCSVKWSWQRRPSSWTRRRWLGKKEPTRDSVKSLLSKYRHVMSGILLSVFFKNFYLILTEYNNYLRAVGRKVLWSSACVCLCALPARRFVSRSDTAVYICQLFHFLLPFFVLLFHHSENNLIYFDICVAEC